MEALLNPSSLFTVAEIQLSYHSKSNTTDLPCVSCSKDAYQLFHSVWDMDRIELQEEFQVMLLNRANKVLGILSMFKGGIHATIADQRLIFAAALKANATGIILAHNHPAGSLRESQQDKLLTEKMVKSGELLEITILDHLIISTDGYLSFADQGFL